MEQNTSKNNLYTFNSSEGMKKHVLTIMILSTMFCMYSFFIVMPEYSQGYNASLIDKVERLKTIDESKVVLIGNSNLTFGINSELLEEEIGMPVVNMGLKGGMGNAFLEEMSKYNVVPGDIYVICHSSFDDDDTIDEPINVWSSIENHFGLWRILRFKDFEIMWCSFPTYLKKCLILFTSDTGNMDPRGVYSRKAFNKYGDIGVLREGSEYLFDSTVEVPRVGEKTVERINRLNRYFKERGATLLVAGYPIANGRLTENAQKYMAFQERLSEALDCPVISNYSDYMLDYKYFYNTDLHLNTEGANIRTAQLVRDLKRWQDTGLDANMKNDEYMDIVTDVNLSHITNTNDYLEALIGAKTRYTVIISAKDDASAELNDGIMKRLHDLGVNTDLQNKFRYSYIGVISGGTSYVEELEHERIEINGNLDEKEEYSITSGGFDRGNCSSILINGQEFSRNQRGLNFVVYSNETHRIIDEASIDTHSGDLVVNR